MSIDIDPVSGAIALVALVVAVVSLWRTAQHEKTRHVKALSLLYEHAVGEIDERNHDRIVLRNDGDTSVMLGEVGMAYGNWAAVDRSTPEAWAVVAIHRSSLLRPGDELRLPAPDDPSDVGIIGPIAFLSDPNGREWQVIIGSRVQLGDVSFRPPRRRDRWFERRGWFERVDGWLGRHAVMLTDRHPGWYPWLPLAIDFLWGWRPGEGRRGQMPLNAPLGWRYTVGVQWSEPSVDLEPRYGWRHED